MGGGGWKGSVNKHVCGKNHCCSQAILGQAKIDPSIEAGNHNPSAASNASNKLVNVVTMAETLK